MAGSCPRCSPGDVEVRGAGVAFCRQCGGGFMPLATAFGALRAAGVNNIKLQELLVKQARKVRVCVTCNQMFTSVPWDGEVVHLCMPCGSAWLDRGAIERLTGESRDPPPPPVVRGAGLSQPPTQAPPPALLAPPLPRTVTPLTAKLPALSDAEREELRRPMPSPNGLIPPEGVAAAPPLARTSTPTVTTTQPPFAPAPARTPEHTRPVTKQQQMKPAAKARSAEAAAGASLSLAMKLGVAVLVVVGGAFTLWYVARPDAGALQEIGAGATADFSRASAAVSQAPFTVPRLGNALQTRADDADSSFQAVFFTDADKTPAEIVDGLFGATMKTLDAAPVHVRGMLVTKAEGTVDGRPARARIYIEGKSAYVLVVTGKAEAAADGDRFLESFSD